MSPERERNPVLAVLERLPITTVLSDVTSGAIIWASTPDPRIIGARTATDVVGHNLLDFIDPSQHEIALRDLQAIAEGQSPPPVTYHLRRIRGGTTDVQIASVLTNLGGKPAMLSLVADVSDCQQALRDLAESEERYRQLVETSPDGIAVTGNDGVVYANETLWRALGASSERDVLGKPGLSFVHPDDQATFREIRRRVIRYGKPNPATPVRLVRLDGTTIDTTAQTMFVHWDGEPATQTSLRDLATAAP